MRRCCAQKTRRREIEGNKDRDVLGKEKGVLGEEKGGSESAKYFLFWDKILIL